MDKDTKKNEEKETEKGVVEEVREMARETVKGVGQLVVEEVKYTALDVFFDVIDRLF